MSRRRWSSRRVVAMALTVAVWMTTGVGVYLYLSAHRSTFDQAARRPDEANLNARNSPLGHLPGTLYLVQAGTLYRLQQGTFTAVLNSPGGAAGWTQPAFLPHGQGLVVVRRDYAYSDLYLIDREGKVQSQLTHNANTTVELNHWAFYPRLSPDGGSLFFSYDPKDRFNDYNVVFAVWSMPMNGGFEQARKWTSPEHFTGGDIQPAPLPSGALIYTKYTFDGKSSRILGQIYLTTSPGAVGESLTAPEDDCSQPAVSPDGQRLAMICTRGRQLANIEIASFDGRQLGPRQVLVADQLATQPTWAPDGESLVYLAPEGVGGHFQLWQEQVPAASSPSSAAPTPLVTTPATPPPGAIVGRPTVTPTLAVPTPTPAPQPFPLTSKLDFDPTSTIAWHA